MSKALFINAASREITEVSIDDMVQSGVRDLRRMVGGGIELAAHWRNGDVLFCKTEWMRDPCAHFFRVLDVRGATPIGGNAVLVGPDHPDRGSRDARMTVEEAREQIGFLSRADADAFIAGIADQAFASINGVPVVTWAEAWAGMPKPVTKGEKP